jgi:DnaJ-class molecular chaperone
VSIDHTVSPYTAAYGQTLLVDTSGGAVTINLPAAVAGGSSIVVLDVGGAASANNITLDPDGAETISGEATVEIDQDHKGLTLYALAGSWGFKG